VLIIATITDIKKYKIPNWITFPVIIAGTILTYISSVKTGLITTFAIVFLFFLGMLGCFGMGDLKLLMAIVSAQGWFCGLIVVGIASVAVALHKVNLGGYKVDIKRITDKEKRKTGMKVSFAPYMLLGYVFYFFTYILTPQGLII
jgi:Flp pilus assembly protein protease CpaA